jgi:hypothetical protein
MSVWIFQMGRKVEAGMKGWQAIAHQAPRKAETYLTEEWHHFMPAIFVGVRIETLC